MKLSYYEKFLLTAKASILGFLVSSTNSFIYGAKPNSDITPAKQEIVSNSDFNALRQELDLLYSRKFDIALVNDEVFINQVFAKENIQLMNKISSQENILKEEADLLNKAANDLSKERVIISAQEYEEKMMKLNRLIQEFKLRQQTISSQAMKEQQDLSVSIMEILEKAAKEYVAKHENTIWVLHSQTSILLNQNTSSPIRIIDITEQLIDIAIQIKSQQG